MRLSSFLLFLSACGVEAPERRIPAGEERSGLSPSKQASERFVSHTLECDDGTADVTPPCPNEGFAPDAPKSSWRHWTSRVTAMGNTKHRGVDRIVSPGQPQTIVAKIAYGVFDVDLQDEVVEIWVQTACNAWRKMGSVLTTDGSAEPFAGVEDDGGRVFFTLPEELPVGDYRVRLLVKGDHSSGDMWLRVWPLGTRLVVSDIDGTMTSEENDGLWSAFDPDVAEAQPAAPDLMQAYYAKGYRVLFLTARPEFLTNTTRAWFSRNGFPHATFHLSQSNFGEHGPEAQQYKQAYLQHLIDEQGMFVEWAYGNKVTDLDAYLGAHLDNIVLIEGEYSGDLKGATMVKDYVEEAQRVACMPPLP